jgi:hypothetical protein
MGKQRHRAGWIVCFVALSGILAADIAPPGPKPYKPYLGVDIAVIRVGTTGNPEWEPTFTLKNLGTKRIRRFLEMVVKSNGGVIAAGSQWVDLYPTKTVLWVGGPSLCNYAKVGDVVEATIDTNNMLIEDNESNNTLSKKITLILPAGAISTNKKK